MHEVWSQLHMLICRASCWISLQCTCTIQHLQALCCLHNLYVVNLYYVLTGATLTDIRKITSQQKTAAMTRPQQLK